MIQDAPDEQRFDSGNGESLNPNTVAEQAATEIDLDLPLNPQQAEQDRCLPRSGEGEGSTGDSANVTEAGQSAALAPKKGE